MTSEDIIAFIVTIGIMDKYRLEDTCLDVLISDLLKSMDDWHRHKNIVVSDKPISANKILPIFQRRLSHSLPNESTISDQEELKNIRQLKVELAKLVDYLKSLPDSNIFMVTINCDQFSYNIFCGETGIEIKAICAMRGKHIPENIF